MKKIKQLIKKLSDGDFYLKILTPLRFVYLPRTEVNLYELTLALTKQLQKNDTHMMAQSVGYGFTMAVFPAIIFMFTLIPYIPVSNLEPAILRFLEEVMPYSFYKEAYPTIIDIISKPNKGLLSFGFAFALFSAQNGALALMAAFNKCLHATERRNLLKLRLTATVLTVLLVLVMVSAVVLLIVGQLVLDYVHRIGILNKDFIYYSISLIKYIVVILLFFVSIALIYILGPSVARSSKFFTWGSAFATTFIILISLGFSLYLNNFANYNKVYGSIGTLIALMIWLYLISFILIIGFQINTSIGILKYGKKKKA